jgi:FtsH-binding integral membrane protein
MEYISHVIAAGLTVYDTQTLKSMYYANSMTEDGESRGAIAGALSLYLDFINMFMALLRLLGDRR